MLQTAHIINILNLVDKDYNNAQIFWALPFQVIYEKVKLLTFQFEEHCFFWGFHLSTYSSTEPSKQASFQTP